MKMLDNTFEISAHVRDEAHAIRTITELAAKYRPAGQQATVAIEDSDSGQVISISRPVPVPLAAEAAHVLGTKLDKARWSDEPWAATIAVTDYKHGADRLMQKISQFMPEGKRLQANATLNDEAIEISCSANPSIDTVQGYLDRNGIRYTIRYAKPKDRTPQGSVDTEK